MLNFLRLFKDSLKIWHRNKASMLFSKLYLHLWTVLRWYGSSLEITRIPKKCKSWSHLSLTRLLIKLKQIYRLISYFICLKKQRVSYQLQETSFYKERPFWKVGMLNSNVLRLLWTKSNFRDGNSNLLLSFRDASIWLGYFEIYFK